MLGCANAEAIGMQRVSIMDGPINGRVRAIVLMFQRADSASSAVWLAHKIPHSYSPRNKINCRGVRGQ
jgi:hypothetical protein